MRIVGGVAGGLALLALWVFLAPTKLGGATTYSITSGISMEPLLHRNDLALIRHESAYRVGEVVLYQNQVINQPVLHRIVLIQGDRYFFKGDNNSFVDPGYATRRQLTGTLWFNVPAAGAVLAWFGVPAHAAVLMGLVAAAVLLTGATTAGHRRRRRRRPGVNTVRPDPVRRVSSGPPPAQRRRDDPTSRPAAGRRPQPYLDGPASTLVATGVCAVLAILLAGTGFGHPVHHSAPLANAFEHSGTFSYEAKATTPTAVYPTGVARTGDPIYSGLVDKVKLDFAYRFSSALPHRITGTIELRALVLSQTDTWTEVASVVPVKKFTTDRASVSANVKLADLYTLINSVAKQTGIAGTNYSADIQPVVRVTGSVGGAPIDEEFSPVLPFAITTAAIRLDLPIAPVPPGATYERTTAGAALASVSNPKKSGSIPHDVDSDVTIARYSISVLLLRVLGSVFAALAVALALIHDVRRRAGPRPSDEERIASRRHAHIVPVTALGPHEAHVNIAVPNFTELVGLALFLERPILYDKRNRFYAVDDVPLRYLTPAIERRHRDVNVAARSVTGRSDPARSVTARSYTRRASDGRKGGASQNGEFGIVPVDVRRGAVAAPDAPSRTRRAPRNRLTRRARRARVAVRGAAVLVVVGVVATLTLSFTAGISVPRAGWVNRCSPVRFPRRVPPGAARSRSPTASS